MFLSLFSPIIVIFYFKRNQKKWLKDLFVGHNFFQNSILKSCIVSVPLMVNLMLFPAVLTMLTLLTIPMFPLPFYVLKIFILLFLQPLPLTMKFFLVINMTPFIIIYVLILIIKNILSLIAKLIKFPLTMAFPFPIAVFMFHQAAVHKLWKYVIFLLLQVIIALKKLFLLLFVIFSGLLYPLISRSMFNPAISVVALKFHVINLMVFSTLLKLVKILCIIFQWIY